MSFHNSSCSNASYSVLVLFYLNVKEKSCVNSVFSLVGEERSPHRSV